MFFYHVLRFILLISVAVSHGARILFLPPIVSASHKLSLLPWADELSRRGHEVVMWAPCLAPDNYITKVAKTIQFVVKSDDQDLMQKYVYFNDSSSAEFTWHAVESMPTMVGQFTYGSIPFMEEILTTHRKIFDSVLEQHWDLVILDELLNLPGYVVAVLTKSPIIIISTSGITPSTAYRSGILSPPTWLPPVGTAEGVSDEMDIVDRFRCSMNYLIHILSDKFYNYLSTQRLRKLLPNLPDLENALIDPEFVFLNHLKGFDWSRPLTPNVEYIGGIHMDGSINRPLSADLYAKVEQYESFMLIAMGHIVNWEIAPESVQDAFWNALRRIPENILIIWQYSGAVPQVLPNNIVLVQWLPQNHPKIKVFVSHCGGHSAMEATHAGVPVLALPFYFDQYDKANGLVKRGAAIRLYKTEITSDIIYSSVMELMDNDKYKLSMLNLKSVVESQMESPLDRAVFWTEFVLDNVDNNFLKRSAMLELYFAQYYCLDIILIIFGVLYVSVQLLRKLLLSALQLKYCTDNNKKQE